MMVEAGQRDMDIGRQLQGSWSVGHVRRWSALPRRSAKVYE